MMFEQTAPYKQGWLDNRSRDVDGRQSVPPSSPSCRQTPDELKQVLAVFGVTSDRRSRIGEVVQLLADLGVNNFQCPSEMTSMVRPDTLMAVSSSIA